MGGQVVLGEALLLRNAEVHWVMVTAGHFLRRPIQSFLQVQWLRQEEWRELSMAFRGLNRRNQLGIS